MATRKKSVTYLVSGDDNIHPSHVNLRIARKTVRYGDAVGQHADSELVADGCFVVVAHGNARGTVGWHWPRTAVSSPWLWVGMPRPPRGCALYLYSCMVGPRLVPFLAGCEVLGHSGPVPMPVDNYRSAVIGFLGKVDEVITNPKLSPKDWRKELSRYVNGVLAEEGLKPNSRMDVMAMLLMFRSSMGNVDD